MVIERKIMANENSSVFIGLQHQDQTYQMSLPQARPMENDVNYGQSVSSGSFQSNKELLANSNLSVTAAPFPHGAANSTTYVSSYQVFTLIEKKRIEQMLNE